MLSLALSCFPVFSLGVPCGALIAVRMCFVLVLFCCVLSLRCAPCCCSRRSLRLPRCLYWCLRSLLLALCSLLCPLCSPGDFRQPRFFAGVPAKRIETER